MHATTMASLHLERTQHVVSKRLVSPGEHSEFAAATASVCTGISLVHGIPPSTTAPEHSISGRLPSAFSSAVTIWHLAILICRVTIGVVGVAPSISLKCKILLAMLLRIVSTLSNSVAMSFWPMFQVTAAIILIAPNPAVRWRRSGRSWCWHWCWFWRWHRWQGARLEV